MTITISASDVRDALSQLRRGDPHYSIKIRWRKGEQMDGTEPGCIVNAVGLPGQEVERSFDTAGEALRYIASLLKMVDARSREQKKKLREATKKRKSG